MESVRDAWTDERLDDLAVRMDRGFERVDRDIRDLRGEVNTRFDRVDARFESLERAMMQAVVALSVGMLAGFGGLAGLIATQI
jgi:hypothetical protein